MNSSLRAEEQSRLLVSRNHFVIHMYSTHEVILEYCLLIILMAFAAVVTFILKFLSSGFHPGPRCGMILKKYMDYS